MKYDAIVLGGGVVGITTAFYLWERGLEVAVVERQPEAAEETSFANGGQISVSHAEPWANPGAQWQVLKWLMKKDSPLYFRPKADLHQLKWIAQWLRNCSRTRTDENTTNLVHLAMESRRELIRVRRRSKVKYDHLTKGILHFYQDQKELDKALYAMDVMRQAGLSIEPTTFDQMAQMEPALAHLGDRIVGGTFAPNDESGDCNLFTKNLANFLESNGVRFFYDSAAVALKDNRVEVHQHDSDTAFVLSSKQFVVAMGSYSYQFVKANFGKELMIYPAKGSSVTVPVIDSKKAPTISLTDDENKLVFSRFGNRLRIAGTAELAGWDSSVNVERCKVVHDKARDLFGDGCEWSNALYWSGLRPTTPSNLPYTERLNDTVVLNCGHGTLGWTLACGSAKRVADMIVK
jgi:D-amino-acid dehydrogenase